MLWATGWSLYGLGLLSLGARTLLDLRGCVRPADFCLAPVAVCAFAAPACLIAS